jgi:prolyl-tRNA synthetase
MRLSQFLLPIVKETPSEAQIASHRLMLRAGMIKQLSAGIYNWLPLGYKVLKKIEQIVREEMDAAGAQELLMPTIQPAELWKESDRYDAYGKEMLRIRDRQDRDLLYGPTNEEVITDIFRSTVKSYKQLPKNLYHIQWKFRDEIRPRFGVMRGREFLMKDAYSFDVDEAAAATSYEIMYEAYLRTFARMRLSAVPVRADTGAIGGDLSHEFHVIADTGESDLYYDATFDQIQSGELTLSTQEMRALYAAADEQHKPEECPIDSNQLCQAKGIEVGHIFYLGEKYSKALGATINTADGKEIPAHMGCYGIGVSRLVGAIIEASHDENGIIWPESVAPFHAVIINLRPGDEACDKAAEGLYQALGKTHDVLYDDISDRPGSKFATADLTGIPWQIVIGPKGLQNGIVELKYRKTGEKQELSSDDVLNKILA